MEIINIITAVLAELWWLVALIVAALIYAARVDVRYNNINKAYMEEVNNSVVKCQYDRDTF